MGYGKMKTKRTLAAVLAACTAFALTGCGNGTAGETAGAMPDQGSGMQGRESPGTGGTEGNYTGITIPESEVGETAVFADYVYEGETMEIIAVEDGDGGMHLSLNTCQVCSGSPYAYFVQEGDGFVCQNCGNFFPTSEIGKERGGCNPVPLEGAIMGNGDIIITEDVLKGYAGYFRNWKGPNA